MKRKKLISLMTTILVMTSIALTGCNKSPKDNPTGTVENGNFNKSGLPIVKEKVTLKMVVSKDARQSDFNQLEFFKKLEERTNVRVEWEQIDAAAYGEKKNIMLASGDYPDAFFNTSALSQTDLLTYGQQGVFLALNDLIDKYAPRVKAAFKQKPIFEKVCTSVDGKIYAVGSANEDEAQYNPDQMFIYKPWLDKLNLPLPTTIDEFYKTLKAFKENDPNGNGKADEIPFSFRQGNSIQGIGSLYGMFGRVEPANHMVVENGKIVFTADKPEYKEAIKYFNKMFREGLFDNEAFTQDLKQYFAKGKTKEVTLGSFMLWNAENMAGAERAKEYVPVPPLKGPSGIQMWTKENGVLGLILGTGFTITNKCQYPEVAIRWVDELFDKKTAVEGFFGPVGTNLKEGPGGTLVYAPVPDGMSFDEFRYKNSPTFSPGAIFAEEKGDGKIVEIHPVNKSKIDIMNKYYKPYMKGETLPPISNTPEEIDFLKTTGTDLQNYVKDTQAKWLLEGGIENEWDAYLAKLKSLKLDEYLKVMQTAYDRFTK